MAFQSISSPSTNQLEIENKFCRETTLVLLKTYKEHPCLYDPDHPNYMERDARAEAYRQVAEKLRVFKPYITVDAVKRKMKTLLNQLHREKSRLKRNPAYFPKLWCFNDIEFLLNKIDKSKMFVSSSSTNIPKQLLRKRRKSSTDDSVDNRINEVQSNNVSGYKSTKKQRRNSLEEVAMAALQIAQSASQNDNVPKQQSTPVEAFCDYLSAEMKQLRPRTFNNLKIDIMELLNDAIIKDQQEDICQSIKEEPPSTPERTFPLTTITTLC